MGSLMREPWSNGGGNTAAPAVLCVLWAPPGRGVDAKLASALQRPRMSVTQLDDEFAVVAALCRDVREQSKGAAARGHILLLVEPTRLPQVPDVLGTLTRHVPNLAIWVFDPGSSDVLRAVSLDDAITLAGGSPPARPVLGGTRFVGAPGATANGNGAALRDVKPPPRDPPAAAPEVASASGLVGPWVDSTVEAWTPPAPTPTPASTSAPTPKLRLTGDGPAPTPPPSPAQAAATPAPVAPQPAPVPPPAPRAPAQASSDSAPLLTDEELSMLLGDDSPRGEGPR